MEELGEDRSVEAREDGVLAPVDGREDVELEFSGESVPGKGLCCA